MTSGHKDNKNCNGNICQKVGVEFLLFLVWDILLHFHSPSPCSNMYLLHRQQTEAGPSPHVRLHWSVKIHA